MFVHSRPGAFHPNGVKGMIMKNIVIHHILYPIVFGAMIGLTVGIADAFLNTPFNPYLFLTAW